MQHPDEVLESGWVSLRDNGLPQFFNSSFFSLGTFTPSFVALKLIFYSLPAFYVSVRPHS
jgi:hypothetical protein